MGEPTDDDRRFLRRAIAAARRGIAAGQTPFGACVVRGGQVIAEAHNEVWSRGDPTAHAEVLAVRAACAAVGGVDLSGCTVYASCEPCPMCFAACHWARVSRVVFGARIADARAAGFSEMPVANERLKALAGSGVEIVAALLRPEAAAVFDEWAAAGRSQPY
jgi:tRNA(Arg) A34 adenosine deaminase TadA